MDSREDNEKWPHAAGNFFWLRRKVKCEAEDPETSKEINRERKKERKAKRNKDLSQAKFQF